MHPSPRKDRSPHRAPWTADRARELTRAYLSVIAPSDQDTVNAALLVVSELVTNALRHAGGVTGFGLRTGPGTLTVTVSDASPDPPRRRCTPVWEPGGFGWPLVLDLASDVRVRSGPKGKTIEATLKLPVEAADVFGEGLSM
ncbi:ATP-binding protein [Streptomyces sp. NPDC057257]|uniref:ATP-binding protein n=1 Tax=Streptomyces sp. NPDC057257 TaxID=3346071 RepID=UPI0036413ABE